MKKSASIILALTLALIGTTEAFAICAQAKPPSKYTGTPPYPYVVKTADPIGIFSKCAMDQTTVQGTWTLYGCIRQTSSTGFTIYVVSTAKGPMRDCIIEHEKAHLFGWQHNGSLMPAVLPLDPHYRGPHPLKRK